MENDAFKLVGIRMIFKKNYGLDIDSAEIDTKLTFNENYNFLYDKYKILINDYLRNHGTK